MELRGPIRIDPNITVNSLTIHSSDNAILPSGIDVVKCKLLGSITNGFTANLTVKNSSKTLQIIKSRDVLAYLQGDIDFSRSNIDFDPSISLFDGLVGPACETHSTVHGVPCRALLDSGSQVTTISRTFYRNHVSSFAPLEPVRDGMLNVEGAGGQQVMYDGFVKLKMSFPSDIVGSSDEIESLALVCPDTNYSRTVPLIVGTNTFRNLKMNSFLHDSPVRSEVRYACRDSNIHESGKVGTVKIFSHRPMKIKPGEICELKGVFRGKIPSTRDALLVQHSIDHPLPDGIQIINGLTPTLGHLPRVKVLVQNITSSPINLNPRDISAELHAVDSESSLNVVKASVHSFMNTRDVNNQNVISMSGVSGKSPVSLSEIDPSSTMGAVVNPVSLSDYESSVLREPLVSLSEMNPQPVLNTSSASPVSQSEIDLPSLSGMQSNSPVSQSEKQPSVPSGDPIEFDFGDSPIPEEWKTRVKQRLNTYSDVFSRHEYDVGRTTSVEHEIKLTPGPVIKERPRPIPARDFEDARRHIQALLDADIIRPSKSPYASAIVLVRKKSGKLRLCVDYRKLNLRTVRDAYPIPRILDIFSALHGSKWFTTMDLKMGFHQIPMAESSKDYTAFVCPFRLFSFERMSQGLTNSPLTFQRLMEQCVGDMNLKELLVYLDDIIVHGGSLEEAEERLFKTLDRLRKYGLKLDPAKCKFFQKQVKHLGHVVCEDGVFPDPDKIALLTEWPKPTTLKELKGFLGFTGYFRQYVEDYSKIVKPLNKLTSGYLPPKTISKLRAKGKKIGKVLTMSSHIDSLWTPECQCAFETIIQKLTSSPVLAFADLSSPFILHTDASNTGLGACLYQQQDNKMRVIAYASRGLSKSEENYPAHKKEFLAMKWAITDKFHDYLYGSRFTVVTDNNPLTYVLSSAKLDATGYRWLAALSVYDFDLKYRRGLNHLDADGLSRRPHERPVGDHEYESTMNDIRWLVNRMEPVSPEESFPMENVSSEGVSAIMQNHGVQVQKGKRPPTNHVKKSEIKARLFAHRTSCTEPDTCVEGLPASEFAIPDSLETPPLLAGQFNMASVGTYDWTSIQESDDEIKTIKQLVHDKKHPSKAEVKAANPELKIYFRELDRLRLINGVLYRHITDDKGLNWQQLVVPRSHRAEAMRGVHDDVSHAGYQASLRLARQRFFWPFMASCVEKKCKTCDRCIRRKAVTEKAGMESIKSSYPLQLVCMDFLSIEPDNKGIKDVLVITDHFTKYALAVPTKNQTARVVAEALWENLISHYGWPERLHSDQGADFQSKVIQELCKIGNMKKSRTTPYHPQGNPVERYNRTLLKMLGTLHSSQKKEWRKYIKPLTHAYNCTVHETTGYAPYYLMFGRHARLPVDLLFGTDPDARRSKSPSQYVTDLKQRLREAYNVASDSAKKSASKNKKRYDSHARAVTLEVGDRVLVRNVNIRGKHKLADRWEEGVYTVKKKVPDIPVYVVSLCDGKGRDRTLHRNLLLPFHSLPLEEEPARVALPERIKPMKTRSQHKNNVTSEYEDEDYEVEALPTEQPVIEINLRPGVILSPNTPEFVPSTQGGIDVVAPGSSDPAIDEDSESVQTSSAAVEEVVEGDLNINQNPVIGEPTVDVVDSVHSDSESDSEISPAVDSVVNEADSEDSDETSVKVPDVAEPAYDNADSDENSESEPRSEDPVADETSEVRRSTRQRHAPKRMTFDTLGEPKVQAMSMAHTCDSQRCSDAASLDNEAQSQWIDWAYSWIY